jgi:uncharacterized protein YjbI with pentapeptide repeats
MPDQPPQRPPGPDPGPSGQNAPRPSPVQWKAADELKHIIARHRGWLADQSGSALQIETRDDYLECISPAYPNWLDEARSHPEQANLSDANLSKAILVDADLSSADLRRTDLSRADLRRTNLSNATLSGATLSGANLSNAILNIADLSHANLVDAILVDADLSGADLSNAILSNANLVGADLRNADLSGADLSNVILSSAILVGADLSNADLSNADLRNADLRNADLRNAILSGANLQHADLTKVKLAYADLTNALYAPASESPYPYVAGIRGLSTVRIPPGEEVGLVQLRMLLQDAGLRDLEREATYSVERLRTSVRLTSVKLKKFRWLDGIFRLVAFDWTTAYGLHPGRALWLVVLLWMVFVPVYWCSIQFPPPTQVSGIYRVFLKGAIDESPSSHPIHPPLVEKARTDRVQETGVQALRTAAYFSFLSVTNIGFQQFTLSDWIRRVGQQDATLQAVGLVHAVAGFQALMGLYLLAIWVLTYFGRPFQ